MAKVFKDGQFREEEDKKADDTPYSPSSTGVNPNRATPRSINPISPYEDQLQEARKYDEVTQEETDLSGQAKELETKPEDADASMWARLGDIAAQTSSNYAKASGIAVPDKPFNEATTALTQKQALKENLRKNLLEKVQAAKAEREAKKKSLYEQIGVGMKVAGEGREVSQENRTSADFATKQKEQARLEEPLTPQQIKMYEGLSRQRGVKIDLSSAKQRDVSDIEKAIGLGLKPESPTGGSRLAMPAQSAMVANVNKALAKYGLSPLPEDGSVTLGDVQSAEMRVAELRRTMGNLSSIDSEGARDAQTWLSAQPEKTKLFVANTVKEFNRDRKAVDSEAQDIQLLESLMSELDAGNAFAGQTLKNRLPRVVGGEKGVLTSDDVNRLSGSQTYWNQLNQFFNNKITVGSPFTDKDKKEIRSAMAAIKGNQGINLKKAEDRASATLRTGLGPNAPASLLYGGGQIPSTQATQSGTMSSQVAPKSTAPHGEVVIQNGKRFKWDGTKYVKDEG